jgi:hypothetical protein
LSIRAGLRDRLIGLPAAPRLDHLLPQWWPRRGQGPPDEQHAGLADRKDDCHAIKKTTGDKLSFILAILWDREPRCSAWSIRSTAEVRGTYSIRDRF